MMNIEFLNNTFGKYLKLTQNGNTFNILFGSNLDLYFQPVMNRMELFTSDEHLEFKISKEDGFLYEAFMHLYEKIINYIPLEEMDSKREREYQKLKDSYRPFPLVHDKVISWHSDEEDVDTSSILNISKTEDNQIKLEFIKNKPEDDLYLTYAIRFRNSGSTYDPFNFRFMELYNSLCNYYENYQPNHKEKQLQK
mgnify:FL=1